MATDQCYDLLAPAQRGKADTITNVNKPAQAEVLLDDICDVCWASCAQQGSTGKRSGRWPSGAPAHTGLCQGSVSGTSIRGWYVLVSLEVWHCQQYA